MRSRRHRNERAQRASRLEASATRTSAVRHALRLAILAQVLSAGRAAGDLIRPTIDFNDMRVVVAYVTARELASLQRDFGVRFDLRDLRQDHRHGFSILKKNRETGALTCEIYLPDEKIPKEVDDEATLSLGHELLHCMRGDYHR